MKGLSPRLLFFIILLVIFNNSNWAQDLIVLRNGDSLNCTIKKIGQEKVETYKIINGKKVYSDITPTDVKLFSYDYYKN